MKLYLVLAMMHSFVLYLSHLLISVFRIMFLQFITQTSGIPFEVEQREEAAKILSHISNYHFSVLFNRIALRLDLLS